jgi:hypothetical protein
LPVPLDEAALSPPVQLSIPPHYKAAVLRAYHVAGVAGGSFASPQSVLARMAGCDGWRRIACQRAGISGMVVSPVLGCEILRHYEWNGSLLFASRGCSCSRQEAAGDARSPLRDRGALGSALDDWWCALEPATMFVE